MPGSGRRPEGPDVKAGLVFCYVDGSLFRKHVVHTELLKLTATAKVLRIEFRGCVTLARRFCWWRT